MDFINEILAQIFDTFKAKNPKIAAILVLIFGGIIWFADNGLGELINQDLTPYVKWIAFLLAALQGSRTTFILQNTKSEPPTR